MIVVTGMHRAGTSLVANLLSELGVPFGDPAGFYPPDRWNPRGYFEQRDVLDLNNRILTGQPYTQGGFRRRLGQLRYVTRPGPATVARRFARLAPDARALAEKYVGVAVKDPRFCLTASLWRAEGAVERVVVCLRHPNRSVRSLERRQWVPSFVGLRFWEYHMAALLEELSRGGLDVLCMDYDRLASGNWRGQLEAADAFFSLGTDAAVRERVFGEVFSAALNHSAQDAEAPLPARARELWERLGALARA